MKNALPTRTLLPAILLLAWLSPWVMAWPSSAVAQEPPAVNQPGQEADPVDIWLPELTDVYTFLDELDCVGVAQFCQETIPQLFYGAHADSLLDMLFYWEEACGRSEPMQRTLVLGAIWDGAFSEDIYVGNIIDYLLWNVDPVRQEDHRRDFQPDLASGGVASVADFTSERENFDAFTTDLADQLLPHQPEGTSEHFFCLFYSGRTEQAWALLRDRRLAGTELQNMYDWEFERQELKEAPWSLSLTGNYWRPEGNLARAGQKPGLGFIAEKRREKLFYRVTAEALLGRSRFPYEVVRDGLVERSDRFSSVALGFEGGTTLLNHAGFQFDLFVGFGLGATPPFLDEDKGEDWTGTVLVHALGLVGAGCRYPVDDQGRWSMGFDLSRQWISDRNDGGTPLDGQAWAARVVFTYNPNHDLQRRLRLLGAEN
jgi:hypothetical protein